MSDTLHDLEREVATLHANGVNTEELQRLLARVRDHLNRVESEAPAPLAPTEVPPLGEEDAIAVTLRVLENYEMVEAADALRAKIGPPLDAVVAGDQVEAEIIPGPEANTAPTPSEGAE